MSTLDYYLRKRLWKYSDRIGYCEYPECCNFIFPSWGLWCPSHALPSCDTGTILMMPPSYLEVVLDNL